jgi:hypothetical protein
VLKLGSAETWADQVVAVGYVVIKLSAPMVSQLLRRTEVGVIASLEADILEAVWRTSMAQAYMGKTSFFQGSGIGALAAVMRLINNQGNDSSLGQ